MSSELRQKAYTRRASQHDDLEESRSLHEQFRSSMFSASKADRLNARTTISGGAGGAGSSCDSSESTTAARIDAAIKAAMAHDATRGANTFNRLNLTPEGSAASLGGPGRGGGGGGGAPYPRMGGGDYYRDSGSGSGYAGAYRTYNPGSASGGGDSTGYMNRPPAADDSVATGSVSHRSMSGGSGSGGGGGGGRVSGGVGAAAMDPFFHRVPGGGSGGSGGGGRVTAPHHHQQQTRAIWEPRANVPPAPRPAWQPDPSVEAEEPEDTSSSASSGGGDARLAKLHPQPSRDFQEHHQADSMGAIAPPERPQDMPPVRTDGGSGGDALDHMGGGGAGVALTPAGYDEPLELPDGCHHISLAKFLEVMTGPGLRVRKHHRAGKGSSGLRVLRYNAEGDSLTWDSHKILGAAQHVLPMSDVENVSMQPGKRVVLMCVGGKDSYAVFEAANDDAAAVLYVGLERLRERTQSGVDAV
ncbi:hypothetical protein Esi_0176_0038 [Ectocarpus siliculosus]|uniref:Uncharacterized protein n=1 Tax=Ectocarpus siliculosus TaxID=2880 RepID=D8LGR7_ECTSI|nr:hypothetical protein Esi_0176_0038 [Ectocarpus siliculosus]|eukprot:CBN79087.1 hypothetical protein Esi_0176_0038 [Ectocarpus siliculosus]